MADEKDNPASEAAPAKSSKKKVVAMGGILLAVMAIEGAVVFMLVKPSPASVNAAPPVEGMTAAADVKPQLVEIEVVKLRAQNERAQRYVTYDLDVYVSVTDANKDKVNDVLARRKATIQDRLGRIIRAAEPERFTEPDLRTLRRQFKAELGQIIGEEGLISEVLIPSIVCNEN